MEGCIVALKLSSLGGGNTNNFNIDIGSSGNTTASLGSTYPSGGYSITSQLSDSSMDIYAIAEDGSLSGYTSSKGLIATKDFDTIVIFGATSNDLLTFEYKTTVSPSSSGDEVSAAPFITSISASNLVDIDDTTIIYGGNFSTSIEAYFVGSDNIDRAAKSIVRSSISELIVTRPDNLPAEYSPYSIKLINNGISNPSATNVNILTNSVSAGSSPTWSTDSIDAAIYNSSYSFSLSASDSDGGAIEYSIVSGSLPTGLTLNQSTGSISGTPSNSEELGTIDITFRATDQGGNYLDKQLQLIYAEYPITGGTVTEFGGYKIHTFDSSDNLTVNVSKDIEYLIVAGGGAGGWDVGGGGGAGGLLSGSETIANPGTYPIVIGAGAAYITSNSERNSGSNSSFRSLTAIGGGAGGNWCNGAAAQNGLSGGSGGGAGGWQQASSLPGSGTSGQGYAGGTRTASGSGWTGTGGGGAGGSGSTNVNSSPSSVSGGPGVSSSISGTSITYASGGKGGGDTWTGASNGSINTGNGGDGAGTTLNGTYGGGSGGSGIVIIRYLI